MYDEIKIGDIITVQVEANLDTGFSQGRVLEKLPDGRILVSTQTRTIEFYTEPKTKDAAPKKKSREKFVDIVGEFKWDEFKHPSWKLMSIRQNSAV